SARRNDLRRRYLRLSVCRLSRCLVSVVGDKAQSVFTLAAKQLDGFASIPTQSIPRFMHSTRVAPAPQKVSRTVSVLRIPRRSIRNPTTRSEYPRTSRYQLCTSPFRNTCRPRRGLSREWWGAAAGGVASDESLPVIGEPRF